MEGNLKDRPDFRQPKSYHDVKGSDKRIVVCQGG